MKTFRDSLLALCCLAHSLSAQSSPSTGLMTVADYEAQHGSIVNDIHFLPSTGKTKNRTYINLNSWNRTLGINTHGTPISPQYADTYIVNLFNNGLMKDIKGLSHWDSTKPFDDLLNKKPLVIVACDKTYNNSNTAVSSVLKSSITANKTGPSFSCQLLGIAFDVMANKKRGCFSSNNDYDLRTTLAHEMGHQYVLHHYPHLASIVPPQKKLTDKQKARYKTVAYVAQEAFAVYTEYRYLRYLADNQIINNFSIADFINDTTKKDSSGKYGAQYGVTPEYMIAFIHGLDFAKIKTKTNGSTNKKELDDISFSHQFLENSSKLNYNIYNKKKLTDKDFRHTLILARDSNGTPLNAIEIDYRDLVDTHSENAWDYYKDSLKQVPMGNGVNGCSMAPWFTLSPAANKAFISEKSIHELAMAHNKHFFSKFFGQINMEQLKKNAIQPLRENQRKILIHDVLQHLIAHINSPAQPSPTSSTGN